MNTKINENSNFNNLNLSPELLEIIKQQKFQNPTEIQLKAIPKLLNGENIVCGAPTGSGKTLVYLARIIELTKLNKGVQSLIIVPTRELAIQVYGMVQQFLKIKDFNISSIYGGLNINTEIELLKQSEIVISTPARLRHHIHKKTINLEKLKLLVLDEVDILLSEQTKNDIEFIIKNTPKTKQMALFSATITDVITKLAQKYVKKSSKILVGKQVDNSKLKQLYYEISPDEKISLLNHLLKYEQQGLSLIFVNREQLVNFIIKNIKIKGLKIVGVYADMSQSKRTKILSDFKNSKIDVLITTDIYSRGLDIQGISHIYNYSIPKDNSTYIHRIGRTARGEFGTGKVISFVSPKDAQKFVSVININSFLPIKKKLPEFEKIKVKQLESQKDFNKKLKTYRK